MSNNKENTKVMEFLPALCVLAKDCFFFSIHVHTGRALKCDLYLICREVWHNNEINTGNLIVGKSLAVALP